MSLLKSVRRLGLKVVRAVRRWAPDRWPLTTPNPLLAEALGPWSIKGSDINDHLGMIFVEAISARPRLIVELGTREGISTRAMLAAAEIADAQVLSIDIMDCSSVDLPDRLRTRWTFIQADDVAFAGEPFATFCASRQLPALADVILIDTSHRYEHTRAELKSWLPRLASNGVMLFHDTNMASGFTRRLGGKIDFGWDNDRGVIRAIEEQLGRRYDEKSYFTDVVAGYTVRHFPWSSGLTVLQRRDANGAINN
jgi:predicted O-methyltransferase YrrM